MTRRLARIVAYGLLGAPAAPAGQPAGSQAGASGAKAADAPSVRVVVPQRPYLRQRASQLSDELRTPDDRSKPWLDWERATGNWGGLRPRLHERGIIPEIEFTGQLFSKLRGGASGDDATRAAATAGTPASTSTGAPGSSAAASSRSPS